MNLTVPVWTRSSLARKKGATATKDARYATKYLDTAGTLGISMKFHPRFRFRKGAVKRAEQEGLDVVQGGHSEFSHALL